MTKRLLLLAVAFPLGAQSPLPTNNAKVKEVIDLIKADKAWTFQQQLEIVQNIPISMGIPAIRLTGGGKADGAHSLDEWYLETADSYLGPQWAALVVSALASVAPVGVVP